MGPTQLVALLGIPFLAMTTWAQPSQQPATTIAAAADQEISLVEKEFVTAAEAMPEDKFDFSPEKLNIPGSAFKDVRTFAWEVKHVAASNYFLWSLVTGDPIPQNVSSEKGLDQMKTKADILRFLKSLLSWDTRPRLG